MAGLQADHEATYLEDHWRLLLPALHHLQEIQCLANHDVTVHLFLTLIAAQLNYCNAVFTGLLQCTILMLQQVQNAAAHLICEAGPHDPITPMLIQLNGYQPDSALFSNCVHCCIQAGNSTSYLADSVELVPAMPALSGVRSVGSSNYLLPCLQTKHDE